MTKAYTGGCGGGAIRYETMREPIFENHGQGGDCQKRSGTGHGSYLTFPQRADVTIMGEAKNWRVAGDSCQRRSKFRPKGGAKPDHLRRTHETSGRAEPERGSPDCAANFKGYQPSFRARLWDIRYVCPFLQRM